MPLVAVIPDIATKAGSCVLRSCARGTRLTTGVRPGAPSFPFTSPPFRHHCSSWISVIQQSQLPLLEHSLWLFRAGCSLRFGRSLSCRTGGSSRRLTDLLVSFASPRSLSLSSPRLPSLSLLILTRWSPVLTNRVYPIPVSSSISRLGVVRFHFPKSRLSPSRLGLLWFCIFGHDRTKFGCWLTLCRHMVMLWTGVGWKESWGIILPVWFWQYWNNGC